MIPEDKDAYLATIPLARWGVPEDVGNAVDISLDEASFITGQTLCVNGGRRPRSLLKSNPSNYMKHSIQK